jgi:hypothetical protein
MTGLAGAVLEPLHRPQIKISNQNLRVPERAFAATLRHLHPHAATAVAKGAAAGVAGCTSADHRHQFWITTACRPFPGARLARPFPAIRG